MKTTAAAVGFLLIVLLGIGAFLTAPAGEAGERTVGVMSWGWRALVLTLIPASILLVLPSLARVAFGPSEYRVRWFALQAAVWTGAAIFWTCGAVWIEANFTDDSGYGGALIVGLFPTGVFVPAGYLLAMSLMPPGFFERTRFGRGVRAFLGVDRGRNAPRRCLWGGAALVCFSLFLLWMMTTDWTV